MTTTQRRYALIIALALTVFLTCACLGDDGERSEWQAEVLSRQRGQERPTVTPPAEVAERTE